MLFYLISIFSNYLLPSFTIQYRWIRSPIFATSVFVHVESSSLLSRSRSTMLLQFGLSYLLRELVCYWKIWRIGGIWTAELPVAVRGLYPLDHGDPPWLLWPIFFLLFWAKLQLFSKTLEKCEQRYLMFKKIIKDWYKYQGNQIRILVGVFAPMCVLWNVFILEIKEHFCI